MVFILCFICHILEVKAEPIIHEKFTYNILWAGIRVGSATFVYEETRKGVILKSSAISSSFISLFHKVNDTAQSVLYPDLSPREYILNIWAGDANGHKATYFDLKQEDMPQKVIYKSSLDTETQEFSLEEKTFDPLSGFHEIRHRMLKIGQPEYLQVFNNKKLWKVEVQVIRKEQIQIPLGKFDTILIKLLFYQEGLFLRKGDFYIWLTDDKKRIPILIKTQLNQFNITTQLTDGIY